MKNKIKWWNKKHGNISKVKDVIKKIAHLLQHIYYCNQK